MCQQRRTFWLKRKVIRKSESDLLLLFFAFYCYLHLVLVSQCSYGLESFLGRLLIWFSNSIHPLPFAELVLELELHFRSYLGRYFNDSSDFYREMNLDCACYLFPSAVLAELVSTIMQSSFTSSQEFPQLSQAGKRCVGFDLPLSAQSAISCPIRYLTIFWPSRFVQIHTCNLSTCLLP